MELISVIIPIYKVERYLDRCIESVVNQTYKNLEIILVDDGSPDNCPFICDDWAKKDNRIKVIHKLNGGLSDARNNGLKVASGEYISFVDSDDWVESCFLEKLYRIMQQENADVVGCGVAYASEEGKILKSKSCSKPLLNMTKIEALRQLILEKEITQTVWNKLYRREVIRDILFEVGKCHEDDFWTYRIIDRANKVTMISDLLYNYLQREGSIMGNGYTIKRIDGLEARFLRMQYLQKHPELTDVIMVAFMYECLYHFQAAVRCLEADEQRMVTDYVLDKMKYVPVFHDKNYNVSFKYKIWFSLFRKYPFFTARVRNKLGIGL